MGESEPVMDLTAAHGVRRRDGEGKKVSTVPGTGRS
jgi:hypothetical protein